MSRSAGSWSKSRGNGALARKMLTAESEAKNGKPDWRVSSNRGPDSYPDYLRTCRAERNRSITMSRVVAARKISGPIAMSSLQGLFGRSSLSFPMDRPLATRRNAASQGQRNVHLRGLVVESPNAVIRSVPTNTKPRATTG
jgi:hypothetical protein